MTNFTLSIQGQKPITGALELPAPRFIGWRSLFDCEGGRAAPLDKNPRVVPSNNIAGIPFTADMQFLSWRLMSILNNTISSLQWRAVYSGGRAFTNGNGFDMPDKPQRADFINARDLDMELPQVMKGIICQGNFFRGSIVGSEFVIVPGVGAVDASKPIPSGMEFVNEVIANHWYFIATTGAAGEYGNFPQGNGGAVAIPLFLREPARYPAAWFAKWESDRLPNPLEVGG